MRRDHYPPTRACVAHKDFTCGRLPHPPAAQEGDAHEDDMGDAMVDDDDEDEDVCELFSIAQKNARAVGADEDDEDE